MKKLDEGIAHFNARRFGPARAAFESGASAVPGTLTRTLLEALAAFTRGLEQVGLGALDEAAETLAQADGAFSGLPSELEGLDIDEVQGLVIQCQRLVEEGDAALVLSLPGLRLTRSVDATAWSADADAPIACSCPYCGEPVEVLVDAGGPALERYVEDCSVCCRPWQVMVAREPGEPPQVTLERDS